MRGARCLLALSTIIAQGRAELEAHRRGTMKVWPVDLSDWPLDLSDLNEGLEVAPAAEVLQEAAERQWMLGNYWRDELVFRSCAALAHRRSPR
jgi:hypothetical protein